ncbi:hypothetical protein GCM10010348_70460 [Streptomyces anthocyanicus]|nr:hypothetical protein GCM10010348_70460 [Streptomyces anthocyanicus]
MPFSARRVADTGFATGEAAGRAVQEGRARKRQRSPNDRWAVWDRRVLSAGGRLDSLDRWHVHNLDCQWVV